MENKHHENVKMKYHNYNGYPLFYKISNVWADYGSAESLMYHIVNGSRILGFCSTSKIFPKFSSKSRTKKWYIVYLATT